MNTQTGNVAKTAALVFCLVLVGGISASAQVVLTQPLVISEIKHDISRPLRDIVGSPATATTQAAGPLVVSTAGMNFDGIAATGTRPFPDTNGAVGATQFVEWANPRLAIFDKTTGGLISGPFSASKLWSGFTSPCNTSNSNGGSVEYDKAAGRWVIARFAGPLSGLFYECFAVSTSSDATGTYARYIFPLTGDFPDSGRLGVWPDAYYMAFNRKTTTTPITILGSLDCAMDRSSMLAGAAATAQCFETDSTVTIYKNLLPSDLDGPMPPPAGSPDFFLTMGPNSLTGTKVFRLFKFHVDFVTPANSTFTGPASIPVTPFKLACNGGPCIPQMTSTQLLLSLGNVLMSRLVYRNFGDHDVLLVNHSINPTTGANSAIQWEVINNPGGTPALDTTQSGVYEPNAASRWMGSIAMDKMGDIAIGFSASSPFLNPAIHYSVRVPSDPAGTLEGPPDTVIIEGPGGQQPPDSQWGHVSSMTVDPADDCTFWYTNEYLPADGTNNWLTRIATFKIPSCL